MLRSALHRSGASGSRSPRADREIPRARPGEYTLHGAPKPSTIANEGAAVVHGQHGMKAEHPVSADKVVGHPTNK
jgi:hypothetical protein